MSFIVWDIFENILQMKYYKKKVEESSKKGAGGDEKHAFSFTWPKIYQIESYLFFLKVFTPYQFRFTFSDTLQQQQMGNW